MRRMSYTRARYPDSSIPDTRSSLEIGLEQHFLLFATLGSVSGNLLCECSAVVKVAKKERIVAGPTYGQLKACLDAMRSSIVSSTEGRIHYLYDLYSAEYLSFLTEIYMYWYTRQLETTECWSDTARSIDMCYAKGKLSPSEYADIIDTVTRCSEQIEEAHLVYDFSQPPGVDLSNVWVKWDYEPWGSESYSVLVDRALKQAFDGTLYREDVLRKFYLDSLLLSSKVERDRALGNLSALKAGVEFSRLKWFIQQTKEE